jgi:hypothetical protein
MNGPLETVRRWKGTRILLSELARSDTGDRLSGVTSFSELFLAKGVVVDDSSKHTTLSCLAMNLRILPLNDLVYGDFALARDLGDVYSCLPSLSFRAKACADLP